MCGLCKAHATMPGVGVQHVLYPPGFSVSYACLCHNTRNFWKFCNTSILVPESSGSSVRPPYPCPESTNPTDLKRENLFLSAAREAECGGGALPGTVCSLPIVVENRKEVETTSVRVQHEYSDDEDLLYMGDCSKI